MVQTIQMIVRYLVHWYLYYQICIIIIEILMSFLFSIFGYILARVLLVFKTWNRNTKNMHKREL